MVVIEFLVHISQYIICLVQINALEYTKSLLREIYQCSSAVFPVQYNVGRFNTLTGEHSQRAPINPQIIQKKKNQERE